MGENITRRTLTRLPLMCSQHYDIAPDVQLAALAQARKRTAVPVVCNAIIFRVTPLPAGLMGCKQAIAGHDN